MRKQSQRSKFCIHASVGLLVHTLTGFFSGLGVPDMARVGLWLGVLGRQDTTAGGGGGGAGGKLVLGGCKAGKQVVSGSGFSTAELFSLAGLLLLTSSAKLMPPILEEVTGTWDFSCLGAASFAGFMSFI